MAMRSKTVRYAFDSNDSALAAATRYDFASRTLKIIETNNRRFTSVILEVTARDNSATAVSITGWLLGIKLGAVAFDDQSTSSTITNSGEHQWMPFRRNVTSYFNTNFGTGQTQTCQAGVSFTAFPSINITATLIITYEFDDAGETRRMKTIPIVIDSNTTVLTATLAAVGGTGAIPKLTGTGGVIEETNPTIEDLYFEIVGNEATTVATDWQLGMQIDAGAEKLDGLHEQALISSTLYRYVWRQAALDPTVAHDLNMRGTVASLMCFQRVVIWVTYSFDAASARATNARMWPVGFQGPSPSLSNGPHHYYHPFQIPEPGTITLKQSGIGLYFTIGSNQNFLMRFGTQSYRAYTHTPGTVTAGAYAVSQRFDAGAVGGTGGLTLTNGDNVLEMDYYSTTAYTHSCVGGMIYLLYGSDVSPSGIDAHTHSVCYAVKDTGTSITNAISVTSITPNIPEPIYKLEEAGWVFEMNALTPYTIFSEALGNAAERDGWRMLIGELVNSDGENGAHYIHVDARRYFKRWQDDATVGLLDPELAHDLRFYISIATWMAVDFWMTYHSIEHYVANNIHGYSGTGAGITVDLINPDGIKVGSDVTILGGAYTIPVADTRAGHYTTARVDSTHLGRSNNGTPSASVAPYRDGPSSVYRPTTDRQWESLGIRSPRYYYLLEDTSGNPIERRGPIPLTAGGTRLYRQTVTGWKSPFAGWTFGSTNSFRHASGVGVDVGTTSFAMLFYAALEANTGGVRVFAQMGSTALLRTTSAGLINITVNGVATALGVQNHSSLTTVRPYLWVFNRTAASAVLYTDLEQITAVYDAALADGFKGLGNQGGNADELYSNLIAMWSGADAEAQGKSTLTALGHSLPF